MKKACIIAGSKYGAGGVAVFNRYLSNILTKMGYEVIFCTSDNIKKSISNRILKLFFNDYLFTAKKFKQLNSTFNIIISSGEYNFKIPNTNCINIFHGSWYGYYRMTKEYLELKSKLSIIRGWLLSKKYSKGKYVITVSDFSKNWLEKSGIKVDKVIVNCIDDKRFHKNKNLNERDGYIFLGAFGYNGYPKGYDILQKIGEKLNSNIDVYADIPKNINFNNLIVHETIDNNNLINVYNKYRILIFPSRFEALQLTPLEAMACGCPVVISNVGLGSMLKSVIPEFVVDGWDDYSVNEYCKRIELINSNWEFYSQKAVAYVKEYHSIEKFTKEWESIINQISS